MKKTTFIFFALVILASMYTINIHVVNSQYNEGIHIKADGSIAPLAAPIQRVEELYVLTSNINTSIVIEKNDVVLDGAGHILSSINLVQRSNVTIRNITSYIWLVNVSNSIICESKCNIRLDNSVNNYLFGNNIESGPIGILLSNSINNRIYNNNITGVIRGSFGISLMTSKNNTICENRIEENSVGLSLSGNSTDNTIIRNYFIDNDIHAGGWESFPNIWDNGKVGNYWSGNTNSTYAIQIRFMEDNSVKIDYDNNPQVQSSNSEFPSWIIITTIVIIAAVLVTIIWKKHKFHNNIANKDYTYNRLLNKYSKALFR